MLFNLILDALAESFIERAIVRKWGLQLRDGTWINLILFADKYWLVATTAAMLGEMTNIWLGLQAEYGWETVHHPEGRVQGGHHDQ